MNYKMNNLLTTIILLVILLGGCSGERAGSYESTIENGLTALENEQYEEAVTYFEEAVEENAEDRRAQVLLKQTNQYVEALTLFDQEAYADCLKVIEAMQAVEEGSEILAEKAGCLFNEVETILAAETVNAEEDPFSAYKGIFALFSGAPYETQIEYVFLMHEDAIIEGQRNSEYIVSKIVNKTIVDEVLLIELQMPGNGEQVTQMELELVYDEADNKQLLFETGTALYSITVEEFTDNGFTIPVGYEYWMEEFN